MFKTAPLGLALALALALVACAGRSQRVHRVDFGDSWPLAVETARVSCWGEREAVLIHKGRTYALNGEAERAGHPSPRLLVRWRLPEGRRMRLRPLEVAALSLCD